MKTSVRWLDDGTAEIILPDIKASTPEEAQQIARRLISKAAQEAGIPVKAIDITGTVQTG